MSDTKTAAESIAALVRAETSYVIGGFWTDCCALIRLPGTPDGDFKLTVACGCVDPDPGCGCTCERCLDCDQRDMPCMNPWTCVEMVTTWTPDAPETIQGLAARTMASVGDGDAVVLSGPAGRRPRCVLGEDGKHVEAVVFKGGIVHVAAHYVVAARRYAGVTSWRLVPAVNDVVRHPALAGYAGTTLVALVMPLDFVGCKAEAA